MIVAHSPEELRPASRAVAIGSFDGVHRGHRAVVDAVKATGLVPTVITFDPHPRIALGNKVDLLTTLERRLELLSEAGVEDTLVAAFTPELQQLSPEEFAMKDSLGVGGGTELNLYLTKGGGLLGWAFVPRIRVWDKKYEVLDGVVVNSGSVPGGTIENYDLGHTVTHEVGHWLGLEHTFEKGCLGDGDRVDDTPPQLVPTEGCPVGKDTCPEAGLDPIRNFMDYSYDACYEEFTDGQAARMQAQYLHWRLKH